jgi:outer membrane receptor protein involved in Fe transport
LTNFASLAQPEAVRGTRTFMAAASFAVLAVSLAQPAFAQDASPNQATAVEPATAAQDLSQPQVSTAPVGSPATQEIVVTGSRISRRDYQANSPIVTVDDALLEQAATTSIESNLNKLPQFTPANARTPTTSGGDIQPTARNTPGSAAVSLRGIGANRTLVLINGRRATPSDATGTVDINTIPVSAVERVEIISGGASSTYGADAVAGVTNFIMRSKFTGLELDGQVSLTEVGDNFEYQVSGIMGTNFADDRGNISIAFQANERKRGYNRNRSWYKDLWANPNIAGTGFIPNGYGGIQFSPGNSPSQAVLNSLIPGSPQVPNTFPNYVYVNPSNQTIFSGFDYAARGGAVDAVGVDGYRTKLTAAGDLDSNFVDALTVSPLTRYTAFVQGNYEITDGVEAFFQGNFSNNSTSSVQEPAPIVNGWNATVPYNSLAPQADLPQELRTLLNSRPNPNAPFTVFQMLPGNRASSGDVYSYNLTAGLRGRIPGINWTYEIYGSQGKTQSTVTQTGFGSLQRYRAVVGAVQRDAAGNPILAANGLPIPLNFGQGFRGQSNLENNNNGFASSTATCTSGLNPYSQTAVSNDCLEAVRADIKTRSEMHQTVWEGNVQGKIIDLPAGELRTALGASYRSNNFLFENDTLVTQGRSFLEQTVGLYPAGNSAGKINVTEYFGELLVPILKDIPAIQELNLELGGRLSDYSTTGNSYTYKILGDWKVNDYIRVRGGYNRAERAPNVAELYLALEQNFGTSTGGDVCSRRNAQSWSANPTANPNAARVEALCRVLMNRASPNAATQFYDSGAVQPAPGDGFAFPSLQGNPNLAPETADTWTAGVVLSSPFQSDFLRRLRLSVDYYNIKVDDAIGEQSVQIAQRQCFDTQFNPTLDANSPFCTGINRNADGGLGNVIRTFFNNGRFRTSGIDAVLDWSFPAGPGIVNLNVTVNKLLNLKSSELDVLPLVDFKGTLGPTQNGLNGGAYSWRSFTTVGYSLGGSSLSLQWRHLPSIEQQGSLFATAATPNTISGFPKYDLFNLLGNVAITRDIVLRGGVENLFNKRPPLGGVNSAANPAVGVLAGGGYNAQFYDIIGRRFYIGAKTKF